MPTTSHCRPGHWASTGRRPRRGLVPLPRGPCPRCPPRAPLQLLLGACRGFPASGPASQLLLGHVASGPTSIALRWKIPQGPAAVTVEAGNCDTQGTQGVGFILRVWLGRAGREGVEWDGRVRREQRNPEGRNPLNLRLAFFPRVQCMPLAPGLYACRESPRCLWEGISGSGVQPLHSGTPKL